MPENIITVITRTGLRYKVDISDEIFEKLGVNFKHGERFGSHCGSGEIVGIGKGTDSGDENKDVLWVYLKRDNTFFNRKRASYFSFGQICLLEKI